MQLSPADFTHFKAYKYTYTHTHGHECNYSKNASEFQCLWAFALPEAIIRAPYATSVINISVCEV